MKWTSMKSAKPSKTSSSRRGAVRKSAPEFVPLTEVIFGQFVAKCRDSPSSYARTVQAPRFNLRNFPQSHPKDVFHNSRDCWGSGTNSGAHMTSDDSNIPCA